MRRLTGVTFALGALGALGFGVLIGPATRDASTTDAPPPEAGGPACVRCHRPGEAHPQADYTQAPDCMACHLGVLPSAGPAALRKTSTASGVPVSSTQMVFVPPGPFLMGNNGREDVSEGPGDRDERPRRLIYVDGFSIDLREVSNAQYEPFVIATKHRLPWHWKNGKVPMGKADHPVVYVDWHDASAYCRWAGKRLPTEAEWEKAARGTDGRAFPWGRQFDPLKANTPQYWLHKGRRVAKGDTMPVGRFEAGRSPYGLYDMAGNVYEWTASWYLPYPGNTVPNIHYGLRNKVVRGGSWYDCLTYGCGLSSPAYNRSRFAPEIRNSNFGFRCAITSAGP